MTTYLATIRRFETPCEVRLRIRATSEHDARARAAFMADGLDGWVASVRVDAWPSGWRA